MLRRSLPVAVCASLLLACGAAFAQEPAPQAPEEAFGVAGPLSDRAAARLGAGDRTGLIVVLDAPGLAPVGLADLGPTQLADRRARLAGATERVVSATLGASALPEARAPGFRSSAEGEAAVYNQFSLFPGFAIYANAQEVAALRAHPDVAAVYVDQLSRPLTDATPALVGADDVWALGFDGSGRAVAVLDTGVETEHPSTGPAITASACFNTTIADQSSSLCPNGSDEQINLSGADAGDSCVEDDIDSVNGVDGCFHGTHVASTAAGRPVTLSGGDVVQGVARGASIIAVNVFSRFEPSECEDTENPCVLSYSSDQLAALEWLFTNRVALNLSAVNMSLGGGEFTSACIGNTLRSVVTDLKNAGVATVIASGNDSFTNAVNGPGCIPEAITVGATTDADAVTGFSNSSELVDLLAPGQSVRAAWQTEQPAAGQNCVINNSEPNSEGFCHWFANSSGTSMATPHVAGAYALLQDAFPSASVDDILEALQFTGVQVVDSKNGLARSRIQVDAAYDHLSAGGAVASGVRITPAEAYRTSGGASNAASFASKTYTLTNQAGVARTMTITSAPAWIDASASSFNLSAGQAASLTLSIDPSGVPGADTAAAGVVVLSANSQTVSIPVSVQVDRSTSTADFGPYEWTGDSTATPRSIFRLTGLNGGAPERIDVAIDNAVSGTYANAFTDCSLTIRSDRQSGDEYLIVSADLADCGAFGRADLRFQVSAQTQDINDGIRMRRFTLNSDGGVSDLGFDANGINVSAAGRIAQAFDIGDQAPLLRPAEAGGVWPLGGAAAASADAAAPAATGDAEFGPFEWTGDATQDTGSVFRIAGLDRAAPSAIAIAIDHPAEAGYSGAFSDCSLTLRPERYSGSEFMILQSDLADCGAFGRGDLRLRITADADDIAAGLSVRRYSVTAGGGLSDLGFDNASSAYGAATLVGGQLRADFGPFEWTGDQNAPTSNVFRLIGVNGGAPASITVAVDNASVAGYAGAFTDCTLTIRAERAGQQEYFINNADLADCGDFGRADLTFRVLADLGDVPAGLRMRRLAVGAFSDLTDFGFDALNGAGATPTAIGGGQSEVAFGPFEWVGDGNAPTQSVFRISGIAGGMPASIDVAFERVIDAGSSFTGAFSDCALPLRANRANENEYVLSSGDLTDCGAFGRADLRFRVRADSSLFDSTVRMRRFATTTTGGLTDFGFDNE